MSSTKLDTAIVPSITYSVLVILYLMFRELVNISKICLMYKNGDYQQEASRPESSTVLEVEGTPNDIDLTTQGQMSWGKLKYHMIYYIGVSYKFDKMLHLGDTTF